MPKFRKKPVVIEAVRWLNDNWDELQEFAADCDQKCPIVYCGYGSPLVINTLEGDMLADDGDWIIKGVAGEFYPCKPDIFEKTYENITTDAVKSCEGVNPVGV